ncbi:MAG: LPS assembly lipoprotein LptE [Bacteroidia bacterium]
MQKPFLYIIVLLAPLFLSNCGIYKFNDFQTDGAETIAIHYFDNKAPIVVPQLSQVFTQALKDKYRTESPLIVTNKKGDWDLSGYISQYRTTFLAVKNDEPAKTRLELVIKVKFENTIKTDKSFEREFKQFEDFDSSKELSSVENDLIELLSEKIVVDIYNATVNNW